MFRRRADGRQLRDATFDFDDNGLGPDEWDGEDTGFLTVMLPEMLIQIGIKEPELDLLLGIEDTDWPTRRTIRAGTCNGQPVHWSMDRGATDDSVATFGIGRNTESCQINVALTTTSLARLLDLVRTTRAS